EGTGRRYHRAGECHTHHLLRADGDGRRRDPGSVLRRAGGLLGGRRPVHGRGQGLARARAQDLPAVMDARLRSAIGSRMGAAVIDARALGGGSINEAWAIELETTGGPGRAVYAKANANAPADMFAAEVHGLSFLREGLIGVEGLSVPEVIACEREFLLLELLEPGPPCAGFYELLGRGLASLHRSGAALGYGLER